MAVLQGSFRRDSATDPSLSNKSLAGTVYLQVRISALMLAHIVSGYTDVRIK